MRSQRFDAYTDGPLDMEPGAFFRIVDDPSVFQFGKHNLFKVFYVQFFFSKQLSGPTWQAATPRGVRWALGRLLALGKALAAVVRLSVRRGRASRVVFYSASGRHSVVNDATYDLYNACIVEEHGREHFVIIEDTDDGVAKTYKPDLCLDGFSLIFVALRVLVKVVWRRRLDVYARRLVNRYPTLGFTHAGVVNTVAGFQAQSLVYRLLLGLLAPERVLLICHYGREPFIAAGKHHRLPVIELMHGSITGVDTFYHFPPTYQPLFAQSLFPDRTAVYGEYWRQIILQGNMFPAEAVQIVGYYLKTPERAPKTARDRTVILITGQPPVQDELCAYIAFLKSRLAPARWQIIIKPHPRENVTAYIPLLEPGFIVLSHESVYQLLTQADIHIGVYSSVLYEAIRYDVCNYVLYVQRVAEHCDEVIRSGVALRLQPDQLPDPNAKPQVLSRHYLDDYNPSVLFDL